MLYRIATYVNKENMQITDADVAAWLADRVRAGLKGEIDLGVLEKAVDQVSQECRRQALQTLTQEAAEKTPLICLRCGSGMNVEAYGRWRNINTAVGPVTFCRDYGFCVSCGEHLYPADALLGLQARATGSPRVQELCALNALRGPTGQHGEDLRRMTGLALDPSTVHREARRQGKRARALRDADARSAQTPDGITTLAAKAIIPSSPYTLVIQIDAWNIRERDNWGLTEVLRQRGEDLNRWHWVYTGTVFRLDQRGTTASGRPVIAERGYVATRMGLEAFRHQLYSEALQRGLLQAEQVLIVADGAIWIWNLVDDRFKGAVQRVDLYHVKGHLWALANELFGRGTDDAKGWVTPLLNALERRTDGALDVIHGLEGLRTTMDRLTTEQRAALDREIGYFDQHKNRMDYKKGKHLGQPVGSGAIESTCSQYQRRLKLTGQFWSLEGDEAFLALSTLHRNGRWHLLFPHDRINILDPAA
jgi:hypothetical protein